MSKDLLAVIEKYCKSNNVPYADLTFRIQDFKVVFITELKKIKIERSEEE